MFLTDLWTSKYRIDEKPILQRLDWRGANIGAICHILLYRWPRGRIAAVFKTCHHSRIRGLINFILSVALCRLWRAVSIGKNRDQGREFWHFHGLHSSVCYR